MSFFAQPPLRTGRNETLTGNDFLSFLERRGLPNQAGRAVSAHRAFFTTYPSRGVLRMQCTALQCNVHTSKRKKRVDIRLSNNKKDMDKVGDGLGEGAITCCIHYIYYSVLYNRQLTDIALERQRPKKKKSSDVEMKELIYGSRKG